MIGLNQGISVAVVPVFVNVGAALLPALVAGLASVAALLLKPRELVRIVRAKPYVPLGLGGVCLAGWLVWSWVGAAPVAPSARAGGAGTDWVQVALERLRQEERAAVPGPSGSTANPAGKAAHGIVGALYYRNGAARTGSLGGEAPTGLAPLWEYTQDNTMFCASPLVAGDAVYGASVMLDAGTSYGSVFRLDAATGKPVWTADFKDAARTQDFKGFFSSPAISADGASLVIGQGLHQDANSELVCLDTASGRVRWLVPTPLHIEGSPAIEGDLVVAGAGAIETGDDHKPQGDPGFVMGVRISDGKLLWRHPVIDPESSPAIADGVAYIGSGVNGCAVVALRIAPDEELKAAGLERQVWKTSSPYPATGAVTVVEDLVLIGCGKGDFVMAVPDPEGVVIALDRQTGAERWRVAIPDAVLGAIAARDGKAIVPVKNGEVLALDLRAEGAILWRARVDGTSPILAAPALAGPYVYAVSQNGYLAILRAADGGLVERTYVNAKNKPGEMGLSTSAPFVVNGRLYVGSETGGLRCFE